MNIIHLITGLNIGGAENMLLAISQGLINERHKITVVFLKPSANFLESKFLNSGVQVQCFNLYNFPFIFFNLIRLIFFIHRGRFDILHCHLIHSLLIGLIVRLLLRIRVVVTIHSVNEGGGIFRYIIQRSLGYFSKVFFISDHVLDSFNKNGYYSNTTVLYNFIDFDFVNNNNHNKLDIDYPLFCTISRLDVIKNICSIVESFSYFQKKVPGAKLHIYGNGPDEINIRKLVESLNLNNSIILKGHINSSHEILKSYNFFVTACAAEGFGMSLLEAASHGKFCIAICNPSHKFILEGSVYCHIFDSNCKSFIQDGYDSYMSKYLINNSFEYNLRLRTLFDYNNYIKKLVNIYSEILNI